VDLATNSGRSFYAGLLEALTQVMGTAKGYLYDHGPRVAHLARQIGREMGLPERDIAQLMFASVLCDAGMIGLAEDAWENPVAHLDTETRARVQVHPIRSEAAVTAIPHLEGVAPLVRYHHEWWDGSGYPDALAGEDIPVGARILRLADTVAALGENRPQRPPCSAAEIRRIVEQGKAIEFCPETADAFLGLFDRRLMPDFHAPTFQRVLVSSAQELLPSQISPLSGDQLLEILSTLIDAKDPYTAGHSRRVAILSVACANQLGFGDDMLETVWAAAYLHDLGKLSVPLRVLAKTTALDEDEREEVQLHASVGASILERIPSLRHLSTGARYHHERWDGTGYPEGLRGDQIPLLAQVLAVSDSYDAMTSNRAYRPSKDHEHAMEEIARGTGQHFGPRAAAAFLTLPDHLFHSIRRARAPLRVGGVERRAPRAFERPVESAESQYLVG
jgi:HD-GYP domain-containing protein (c-di-GMP phosphodiesterase class II)